MCFCLWEITACSIFLSHQCWNLYSVYFCCVFYSSTVEMCGFPFIALAERQLNKSHQINLPLQSIYMEKNIYINIYIYRSPSPPPPTESFPLQAEKIARELLRSLLHAVLLLWGLSASASDAFRDCRVLSCPFVPYSSMSPFHEGSGRGWEETWRLSCWGIKRSSPRVKFK